MAASNMVRHWIAVARDTLSRFKSSTEGNVAMMFATALVPMIVATGGFVDYARMWSVETKLQDAADATATMLSKSAGNMSAADMQKAATDFFMANFNAPEAQGLVVTPTYVAADPSIRVTASTSLKTYFLPLVGMRTLPLSTQSTVVWGQSRLRVALALDNTGSMAEDGKMAALKTAAHNLLKQLKDAAHDPEDVYVSIIPFSKDVNVGSTNYKQAWIRWDLWDEVNGKCSNKNYDTKSECESRGKTWTADNHKNWNGCVTDRDQDYDTKNTAPVATATLFPAEEYSNCPVSYMGLSNDWTALNAKIDAMTPTGNTNQPIGLQWGWQSLTAAPFTIPPYDPEYEYRKIVILLTDGLNTENRWYTKQSQIDAREKILCKNINDTDISLYTVQVNTGGDPTSQMLKDCASDPSQTFELKSASQIVSTFNTIGTSLSELRISR